MSMNFEARDYARIPVIQGPDGHPSNHHYYQAVEAAPGVKRGDWLIGERVTEENGTHVLVHNIRIEKL